MEDELLALERRFWVEASGDLYRDAMADDGLMAFAEAGVLDKAATVAAIERAGPWEDVEIEDARVVPLGEDAAGLVYRATGRRRGGTDHTALATSAYVRREGRWLLALHQQSPLR